MTTTMIMNMIARVTMTSQVQRGTVMATPMQAQEDGRGS